MFKNPLKIIEVVFKKYIEAQNEPRPRRMIAGKSKLPLEHRNCNKEAECSPRQNCVWLGTRLRNYNKRVILAIFILCFTLSTTDKSAEERDCVSCV